MKQIYLILTLSLFFSFFGYSQTVNPNVKSLSNKEFKQLIDTKSVTLIDVRTPEEFAENHIPGALNIDVNSTDFVDHIKKLIKKKPLALYCRSGHRSKLAASKLTDLKITIFNLNNGLKDWIQAGFPTEK